MVNLKRVAITVDSFPSSRDAGLIDLPACATFVEARFLDPGAPFNLSLLVALGILVNAGGDGNQEFGFLTVNKIFKNATKASRS